MLRYMIVMVIGCVSPRQVRPHGDVWPALEAACRARFSRMEALPLDGLEPGFRAPHIRLYRLQL